MPAHATPPKYRKHRASGQAVVTLSGHDVYLGPHGSRVSRSEYDRVVAEYLAAGRRWPPQLPESRGLSINELILRYWENHVVVHYVKRGQPSSQQHSIRAGLRPLRRLYGHTAASDFGPLALKVVRGEFVALGLARSTVNRYVDVVRRMFRLGVAEELVPSDVFTRLQALAGLRAGRTSARETAPIRPVSDAAVEAVLPHVPPPVQAMIRLQRLTGMRPGEVVQMRAADVDARGDVWLYRPVRHKLEHRQVRREIYLGPQAQAVLQPWIRGEPEDFLFRPRESEASRNSARRMSRRTPMTPSQMRRQPRHHRRRAPADNYTIASYRRAITRACEVVYKMPDELRRIGAAVAILPEKERAAARDRLRKEASAWRKQYTWHPNQLRHAAATEIRRRFGIDAARTVLGHSHLATTEIYAEQDREAATRIMGVLG